MAKKVQIQVKYSGAIILERADTNHSTMRSVAISTAHTGQSHEQQSGPWPAKGGARRAMGTQ